MATQLSTGFVTSLTTVPDPTQTYFDTALLMNSEYYLFHSRWASKRSLSKRSGKNIILRRYALFAIALGQLTEGEPPTGKTLSNTDFSATLVQFGDFVALTDFAEMTQADEVLNVAVDKLGRQVGYTMDAVDRDVAIAGTGNVIYANGTARTAISTTVDGNDLDRLIRSLQNNGARMMIKGTAAQSGEGTYPTMPGYPCITDPSVYFDIQNLSGFRSIEQYKSGGGTFEGEVGRYKNLVFFVAPDADNLGAGAKVFNAAGAISAVVDNTSGTADVHTILAFGEEYFTQVPLDGESTGTIMKKTGSAGTADPLNQVGTVGWKNTSTRLRTNENWGGRIETGASL
jgi:N4-gp56 family major capsid protein